MEDEPINQNYLIGCDTIEHSPSTIIALSPQQVQATSVFQKDGVSDTSDYSKCSSRA